MKIRKSAVKNWVRSNTHTEPSMNKSSAINQVGPLDVCRCFWRIRRFCYAIHCFERSFRLNKTVAWSHISVLCHFSFRLILGPDAALPMAWNAPRNATGSAALTPPPHAAYPVRLCGSCIRVDWQRLILCSVAAPSDPPYVYWSAFCISPRSTTVVYFWL